MTRHPDERVPDVAVQRLVEASDVVLTEQPDGLVGPCPFHDGDASHALVIDAGANTWRCDTCGIGGGPVEWITRVRKCSRTKAVDYLACAVVGGGNDARAWPAEPEALLDAVVDYYHHTLLGSPDALQYLRQRGLGDEGMIKKLRIGYSNRTVGYRLPSRNSHAGADLRARLQGIGILRQSGHEHLSGSITFPVLDADTHAIDTYGRKITQGLRPGTPQHLFLREDPPAPWLLDHHADSDTLIVTASVVDGLSWWVTGFPLVLVTPTMGATPEQVRAPLGDRQVSRVAIAFPRTGDGDTAAQEILPALQAIGADIFRAVFPQGKDANDVLLASADLSNLVRHAEWMWSPARPEPVPAPAPIESADAADDDQIHGVAADRDEVVVHYGDRRWRVRGLSSNTGLESLRVNIMVTRPDVGMHVDSFDMYSHRHRHGFIRQASVELGVDDKIIKADMGKIILHLEEAQDDRLQAGKDKPAQPHMTPSERDEAMALLRDPRLLDRVVDDMDTIGLVGEPTNKLLCYLVASSRLLDDPLAVLVQSSSGAGKTTLMDTVLRMMPEDQQVSYSAMTGQSLYYMGAGDLRHKVLAVAEDQGVERAMYALKILQSEGGLRIASTDKDPGTGRLITREYHAEGPVALMMTTTSADVDPELANRCIVLTVSEDREQTRAIHERQRHRDTLEGLALRQREQHVLRLHRNAQALLKPMSVVNPFAPGLTFVDHVARTRRDHRKYLNLIRTIALLHQHQRAIKSTVIDGQPIEYIEVIPQDIATANRLFAEVAGQSLDELPPRTRVLLGEIHRLVGEVSKQMGIPPADVRFTRRELRERLHAGQTQLREHLSRLVEYEYVIPHRRGPGGTLYELAWTGEGQDGSRFVLGLSDPSGTTGDHRGGKADSSAPCRADVGPDSAACRDAESKESSGKLGPDRDPGVGAPKTHAQGRHARRRTQCALRRVNTMPPRKGTNVREPTPVGDPQVKNGFSTWVPRYLEWLQVRGFSERTVGNRRAYLGFLVTWLEERSLARPGDVSKPVLERYQRYLYYLRQRNGRPLSFRAQHQRLVAVRSFFKWAARQNVIPANPASELELPRLPHRLPPPVLSPQDVEEIMKQPDTSSLVGLRDRAILETFYTSGIRRTELARLKVVDLDMERGTLTVRLGKGSRDRMVPIGDRAIAWIRRYMDDIRPAWAVLPDEGILFISASGEGLDVDWLTQRVRQYVRQADIGKPGACHAFRHSMATSMLDNGADIRLIQEILGHASLESTQVYTHVSIQRLISVHQATHPASNLKPRTEDELGQLDDAKAELLETLVADDADEAGVADKDPDPR